jgi:hypothetical protein
MKIKQIAVGTLVCVAAVVGTSDLAWARQSRGAADPAGHVRHGRGLTEPSGHR